MLWLLLQSSVTVIRSCFQPPVRGRPVPQNGVTTSFKSNSSVTHSVPELVLPQLVMSLAAITSFHVQIVNRIASGYPTWYMTIAIWLIEGQASSNNVRSKTRGKWAVRGMVGYALIQGMLYANFLPPA
jgi:phosphatidylinositol glycan class V